MPKVVIHLELERESGFTVSDLRRKLAEILAPLDGSQEVSVRFHATLANYTAVPTRSALVRLDPVDPDHTHRYACNLCLLWCLEDGEIDAAMYSATAVAQFKAIPKERRCDHKIPFKFREGD